MACCRACRRRRQIGDDIAAGLLLAHDLRRQIDVRGKREARDVRIARVELLLRRRERLCRAPANSAFADGAADGGGRNARARRAPYRTSCGSVWPAFGERGPVTTRSPFAPRCRAASAL